MRFHDFLRTAVLLFAGAATALAAAAIAGATADDNRALIYGALGWWGLSALVGLWTGRRRRPAPGIERMMASARASSAVPEFEPATVLFARLWWLAVFTVLAGGVAFLLPQIPAAGAGFPIVAALAWRNQSGAVEAVEGRDGVQFFVESAAPLKPTRLVRTPGFTRIEPGGAGATEPAR